MVLRESGSSPPIIFSQLLFVGMYATQEGCNLRVSKLRHYYGLNHLHYLTTSVPQGGIARPSDEGFDSEHFRKQCVATFGEWRGELKFRILRCLLMPEHFHALVWPPAEANRWPPCKSKPGADLFSQLRGSCPTKREPANQHV
jgi:hypothetical protein